jgi:hypothetical protein
MPHAEQSRVADSEKADSFIGYQATLPRIFFVSERRRFDSTSFAFVPRERLAFRRRSLEASANCASFFASAASLIFCSSLRRAVSRFIACERESETVTLKPVGTWRKVTAVETLFTC